MVFSGSPPRRVRFDPHKAMGEASSGYEGGVGMMDVGAFRKFRCAVRSFVGCLRIDRELQERTKTRGYAQRGA